jgi:hypothetical protein
MPRANTCTSPPLRRTTRCRCGRARPAAPRCRAATTSAARRLADLDDLDAVRQRHRGREPVAHDDVGAGQQPPAAHREQPGSPGPAADQRDRAGAGPGRRSGSSPVSSDSASASRSATARAGRGRRHRHDDVVDPRDGGHPRADARVVGAHAPDAPRSQAAATASSTTPVQASTSQAPSTSRPRRPPLDRARRGSRRRPAARRPRRRRRRRAAPGRAARRPVPPPTTRTRRPGRSRCSG